jgi:hypothetical protein
LTLCFSIETLEKALPLLEDKFLLGEERILPRPELDIMFTLGKPPILELTIGVESFCKLVN